MIIPYGANIDPYNNPTTYSDSPNSSNSDNIVEDQKEKEGVKDVENSSWLPGSVDIFENNKGVVLADRVRWIEEETSHPSRMGVNYAATAMVRTGYGNGIVNAGIIGASSAYSLPVPITRLETSTKTTAGFYTAWAKDDNYFSNLVSLDKIYSILDTQNLNAQQKIKTLKDTCKISYGILPSEKKINVYYTDRDGGYVHREAPVFNFFPINEYEKLSDINRKRLFEQSEKIKNFVFCFHKEGKIEKIAILDGKLTRSLGENIVAAIGLDRFNTDLINVKNSKHGYNPNNFWIEKLELEDAKKIKIIPINEKTYQELVDEMFTQYPSFRDVYNSRDITKEELRSDKEEIEAKNARKAEEVKKAKEVKETEEAIKAKRYREHLKRVAELDKSIQEKSKSKIELTDEEKKRVEAVEQMDLFEKEYKKKNSFTYKLKEKVKKMF